MRAFSDPTAIQRQPASMLLVKLLRPVFVGSNRLPKCGTPPPTTHARRGFLTGSWAHAAAVGKRVLTQLHIYFF
jgi:hypothetical protein